MNVRVLIIALVAAVAGLGTGVIALYLLNLAPFLPTGVVLALAGGCGLLILTLTAWGLAYASEQRHELMVVLWTYVAVLLLVLCGTICSSLVFLADRALWSELLS